MSGNYNSREAGHNNPPATMEEFAPEFSEEGLALAFAECHSNRFRWVQEWACWMEWTGVHWHKVKTLAVYDLIRKLCREAAERVNTAAPDGEKLAADLNTAKKRAAVQIITRSDKRFEAVSEQWDADDWLMNTPGGVIDLRSGENLGHDPARYCTKIAGSAPEAGCKIWKAFLDKVTDGDKDLQSYLKRMCGYFLTGSIREHALFFIYGPGGNGKGVFLNTVSAVMGKYHVVSPAQTFAEQRNERHETELARLNGTRLVISQETEQGQYWAESRIKSLTGGDKIAARYMRSDYFEFDPKFKLCIVGNHKPQLRAVDDAIRRRFNLIPFDVRIAPEEKDPDLPRKLEAEYGGILAWMIEGCLDWQRQGLNPPEKVLAATSDYLDSEDTIGLWLSDMCITPDSYKNDPARYKAASVRTVCVCETSLAMLFKSWKGYADERNYPAKSNKFLGEQLSNRGFGKFRDMRGVYIRGLRLKTLAERLLDGAVEDPAAGASGSAQNGWNEAAAYDAMTEHDAVPIPDVLRAHACTHARETPGIWGVSCSVIDDKGEVASNGCYRAEAVGFSSPISSKAAVLDDDGCSDMSEPEGS